MRKRTHEATRLVPTRPAMLRGLVTQHCKRLQREQAQLVSLQDTEARHAVRH
jgi:hypothetical protein